MNSFPLTKFPSLFIIYSNTWLKFLMWLGPGQRINWLHFFKYLDHALDSKKSLTFRKHTLVEVCTPQVLSCIRLSCIGISVNRPLDRDFVSKIIHLTYFITTLFL